MQQIAPQAIVIKLLSRDNFVADRCKNPKSQANKPKTQVKSIPIVYVTNYNTLYADANFTKLTAGQGTVNIIDTHTNEVLPPTIAVGQSPNAITISPNGKFAYVTNYTSNTVNVIQLKD